MILGRRNVPQRSVKPAVVVVIHEFNDRHVSFCEAVELTSTQAFVFQYRVEGLDVSVLIGRSHRYALVFKSQFIAYRLKPLTDKLRSVIRADDHTGIPNLIDPALKGPLKACSGFLGRAAEPDVIIDYHAIVDIHYRLYEEEATFCGDVAVLDVGLP